MEFKQNAPVFTASGQHVGHVDRVVLDPKTDAVAGLVVRKGLFFIDDKVVPIQLIAQATADRVTLRQDIADLHELPEYEDVHYISADDAAVQASVDLARAPGLYSYPPIGASPSYLSTEYAFNSPQYFETEKNIPEGTVALMEGARVISSDGKHVGNIAEIIIDTNTDAVTHIVISHGVLFKEKKLAPITWVTEVTESEVKLSVASDLLHKLPGHKAGDQSAT